MTWIILEALVALLLAVFIVWFTMAGRRKPPPSLPPSSPPINFPTGGPSTGDESGKDTRT
jgi:hypothetical protein